jgi:hypothetical protein
MQVYYDWIEWIKREKRSPVSSRTRQGAGVAKLLAIGKRGILQISNSEMLGLEGPEIHQSGYATIARLFVPA